MNKFCDLPGSATIQLKAANGASLSTPCSLDAMHGKRASLTSRERLAGGATVQIEYNDALLLGEVIACTHNVDDSWHMEVKVEQILTGLQSLMTLRARLLGEPVPEMSTAFAGRR